MYSMQKQVSVNQIKPPRSECQQTPQIFRGFSQMFTMIARTIAYIMCNDLVNSEYRIIILF